ncbi:MAG TPA: sugar ABC transporter permease [Firmicutes bacterium]|nr:sugar ABC transporter permease [Bacillota bacterium]
MTGTRTAGQAAHKRSRLKGIHSRIPLYLMLAPFLILFLLFTVLPILSSVVLSFFTYDMINLPSFAGLDNYLRMFLTDSVFLIAVRNTILFAFVTGPAGFILSFVLAWIINEFNPHIRNLLSFLFFAPSLAGNVYFIWQIMFSSDSYGYVNSLLLSMGLISSPILWLKDTAYAMGIVILVQLWMSMGVSFLANIAGLQNVNTEMYEAGVIDGITNRWQEVWYITLPSMKNILLFGSVMQIQSSFSVGAVAVALTGMPSTNYCTHTIVTHLSDVGTTRFEMGYAAAISVFLFLLMAVSRILIGKLLDMTGR